MKTKVESSKVLDDWKLNSLFKALLFWNQLEGFHGPPIVIVIFQ